MPRPRWNGRLVRELIPRPHTRLLTADRLEWLDRMGTDLRRAWRECDDIMMLNVLALRMGAPSDQLRELIHGLAPDLPRGEGAPPPEVWRRAELGERPAMVEVGTWLMQRGPRTTRVEYEARLERMRAAIRPEDYFEFDADDGNTH